MSFINITLNFIYFSFVWVCVCVYVCIVWRKNFFTDLYIKNVYPNSLECSRHRLYYFSSILIKTFSANRFFAFQINFPTISKSMWKSLIFYISFVLQHLNFPWIEKYFLLLISHAKEFKSLKIGVNFRRLSCVSLYVCVSVCIYKWVSFKDRQSIKSD